MNFRKSLMAATLGIASVMPLAASAITVDGITFDLGAVIEKIDLYEGQALTGAPITAVGQQLVGIGNILLIKNSSNVTTWASSPARELTVYFYNYITEEIDGGDIYFSGGIVEIYSDSTPNFDPSGTVAQGIASATDGTLWLQLKGSPIGGNGANTGNPITLLSETKTRLSQVSIEGFGLLDVTGGLAAAYFDTNTFGCGIVDGPNCPNDADKFFTSSGQLAGGGNWAFTGTGEVSDFAVPEPTSLALLGAGLLGAGLSTRRRRKSA